TTPMPSTLNIRRSKCARPRGPTSWKASFNSWKGGTWSHSTPIRNARGAIAMTTYDLRQATSQPAFKVMKPPRRTFLKFALASVAAPAFSRVAVAGSYPLRPITIVVPVPAGGPTDAIARILYEPMRGSLGQSILIENVSGGDGNIGTGRVARATPDGYTIELGASSTHVFPGALYSLPYDVLNDFAPVAPLATTVPILFSRKTMPTKDLNELIAWLKAHPNKASAGIVSTTGRLLTAFFQKKTWTQFTIVPYPGLAPARQALSAGKIALLVVLPVAPS